MSKKTSYCKKALVLLIAFMMIFTMMPGMAFADGESSVPENVQLSRLVFKDGSSFDYNNDFEFEQPFDQQVKEHNVIVPDYINPSENFYIWATLGENAEGNITIEVIDSDYKVSVRSGRMAGTKVKLPLEQNSLTGCKLVIKVGETEAYIVNVIRKATLQSLELNDSSGILTLTPNFSSSITEYNSEVDADAELTLKPTAVTEAATVKVNGALLKDSSVIFTPTWDSKRMASVTIEVSSENAKSTTYVILLSQPIEELKITKTPDKVEYKIGENFDITGLEVKAVYKDDYSFVIDNKELKISPSTQLCLSTNEVTIGYKANSVKQAISVKSALSGDGTEVNPYKLSSESDFVTLRNEVAAGESFANRIFEITDNINFSSGWEPIGTLKEGTTDAEEGVNILPFSGNVKGNGKTLTFASGSKPLFNYVREASVENFNIKAPFMDGYALVDKYTVDYGEDGTYAEGTGGSYEAGCPDTIEISGVTLQAGSIIKKGGFIGGFASGGNTVIMTDCVVEKGVKIGCNSDASSAENARVGSFAGMVNGKFTNCVSHADVYGKECVGGIAGYKGQSMGWFEIVNCSFDGTVTASGEYAGGIVGAGYSASTAPNTMCVVIKSCISKGKITGKDYVGGILGAEKAIQCWDNGIGRIQNNTFEGTVTSEGSNVGGIVGYMASLNRYTKVLNNYFKADCGAAQGIGKVDYVDTSCSQHETKSGATYFDTSEKLPQIKGVTLTNHNRTDDPLGADKENLCSTSKRSGTYVIDLTASGNCKTHYVGDTLDLTGIELTAEWSDNTTTKVKLDDKNLKISGYNKNKRGVQTIILNYLGAEAEVTVTVLYVTPTKGSVTITLLGDKIHGEPGDDPHGLAMGGLEEWIVAQKVEIDTNTTVWQALQKLTGVKYVNTTGNYISYITYNGVKIGEFDNGKLSGWMYTLNGTHPLLGVSEQFLNNGDVIVFHYTDDYTKEEGSDKWGVPGAGAIEEVKEVTTDKTASTTTSPTDVKVSEKSNADGTKESVATVTVSAENQKEILKQVKENKSKEIILQVSKDDVKDASKADVQLDKSFIEGVLKDTDAKLIVKTPFGDKTYTQDELKALAAAAAGKTVNLEIVKSEKTDEELKAEQLEAAKATVAKASMKARSTKTAKGNVKVVFKPDTKTQNFINEMKDMGYTVKYRFYRSTKKSSGYKAMLTKTSKTYTNTSGKKGTKYYYKVQVRVYDENGKCVAKTALKQCKYASRTWKK